MHSTTWKDRARNDRAWKDRAKNDRAGKDRARNDRAWKNREMGKRSGKITYGSCSSPVKIVSESRPLGFSSP